MSGIHNNRNKNNNNNNIRMLSRKSAAATAATYATIFALFMLVQLCPLNEASIVRHQQVIATLSRMYFSYKNNFPTIFSLRSIKGNSHRHPPRCLGPFSPNICAPGKMAAQTMGPMGKGKNNNSNSNHHSSATFTTDFSSAPVRPRMPSTREAANRAN
jgi:hypothetical protein